MKNKLILLLSLSLLCQLSSADITVFTNDRREIVCKTVQDALDQTNNKPFRMNTNDWMRYIDYASLVQAGCLTSMTIEEIKNLITTYQPTYEISPAVISYYDQIYLNWIDLCNAVNGEGNSKHQSVFDKSSSIYDFLMECNAKLKCFDKNYAPFNQLRYFDVAPCIVQMKKLCGVQFNTDFVLDDIQYPYFQIRQNCRPEIVFMRDFINLMSRMIHKRTITEYFQQRKSDMRVLVVGAGYKQALVFPFSCIDSCPYTINERSSDYIIEPDLIVEFENANPEILGEKQWDLIYLDNLPDLSDSEKRMMLLKQVYRLLRSQGQVIFTARIGIGQRASEEFKALVLKEMNMCGFNKSAYVESYELREFQSHSGFIGHKY